MLFVQWIDIDIIHMSTVQGPSIQKNSLNQAKTSVLNQAKTSVNCWHNRLNTQVRVAMLIRKRKRSLLPSRHAAFDIMTRGSRRSEDQDDPSRCSSRRCFWRAFTFIQVKESPDVPVATTNVITVLELSISPPVTCKMQKMHHMSDEYWKSGDVPDKRHLESPLQHWSCIQHSLKFLSVHSQSPVGDS